MMHSSEECGPHRGLIGSRHPNGAIRIFVGSELRSLLLSLFSSVVAFLSSDAALSVAASSDIAAGSAASAGDEGCIDAASA